MQTSATAINQKLNPPTCEIDGVEYVGRHLSVLELRAMVPVLGAMARLNPVTDAVEWHGLVRVLIDRIFPPEQKTVTVERPRIAQLFGRPRYKTVQVQTEQSVADLVLAQPAAVAMEMVVSFTNCLGQGLSGFVAPSSDETELPGR